MIDPIQIMDELHEISVGIPSTAPIGHNIAVSSDGWNSLRIALESQAAELASIEAELSAGQGDDDGVQILPVFRDDATTAQKVGECLHLLEVRRDVISAYRERDNSQSDTGQECDQARICGICGGGKGFIASERAEALHGGVGHLMNCGYPQAAVALAEYIEREAQHES